MRNRLRGWPLAFVGLVLGLSLFIGVVVSNYAADSPDGLQNVVIDTRCDNAEDKLRCLEQEEGTPVFNAQPKALAGYNNSALSGLVGVLAVFAVGTSSMALLRMGRRRQTADPSSSAATGG